MDFVSIDKCPHHHETVALWHHNQWSKLHKGRKLEDVLSAVKAYQTSPMLPHMWVLEDRDRALGTIELCQHDMKIHRDKSPWLASVYVDEAARKQGIGRKMVEFCIDEAKAREFTELFLFTPDKAHFYRHFGFETIDEPIYKDLNVNVMRKAL